MLWLLLTGLGGTGASLAVPLVVQRVVDGPVVRGDTRGLLMLGALALFFGVVEALLIFIRRWTHAAAAVGLEAAIRDDLYAHLQKLPVSFHDRWQSGQLLSRATSDLGVIRRFLSFGLIYLVVNTITYVTVIAMLIRLYWPLGLVAAASAVPLFIFARQFAQSYLQCSRALQEQQGDVATLAEETALGLRTIRSYGRGRFMAGRFAAEIGELRDIAVDKAALLSRASAKFDLVPNLTLAVVLVAGSIAVADGQLTIGRLVAFASLQLLLVWPIESLGWIIANGQESMTAADRVYEVMDTAPAVQDRPYARVVEPGPGRIVFHDVHFRYPGTTQEVLRGVDLEVRPGETLAIVGLTGSGKTSLVSLVPRLYDATSGHITLDGTDLRDIRLDCLRGLVGVAFEDPVLFSMSVRENITLGAPGATDAQIAEALAVAQAGYVYDLPWGLDTRVGEQGLSLSGGQRQRLALARAVLARPRVLVLDDPLSALDVHTEALVDEALARVLKGTTALIVVHRPSTIALADRVALIEGGRIAAVGTHSDLMATMPAYRAVLAAETAPAQGS
ncbi:ABC transporter ATP-binding protein [Catenuloplanes japonicus]|uniref:ABC transporter ATP-binding protein n=1 Tax=Catenuloplanes japonicus TaxID=33876 RepID=UPI000A0F9E10|nr:ABC transporter ATP-binding protein [Catenuloplanes japonicus]